MTPKTILLIEDNPSDIDLTRRAFAKARIANHLIVVEDGQEAIDYLWGLGAYADRDVYELPALTLLDLKLPIVPGLEVLRRIREDARTRRMPVVILTSSKEEQDLAASYDLCVNSYVRKPVSFQQFVDVIAHFGMYWLLLNESPRLSKCL